MFSSIHCLNTVCKHNHSLIERYKLVTLLTDITSNGKTNIIKKLKHQASSTTKVTIM